MFLDPIKEYRTTKRCINRKDYTVVRVVVEEIDKIDVYPGFCFSDFATKSRNPYRQVSQQTIDRLCDPLRVVIVI